MNSVFIEDLENIINADCINWDKIYGRTVLVTGATGLIGSLIVKTFAYCNKIKSANINVIAFIRDLQKAEKIFENDTIEYGVQFVPGDVMEPIQIDGRIDFIIHGASITESKKMVTEPVETIFTSVEGTKNVLDLAIEKSIESMVYISSMEVYGITDPNKELIYENDLGYIDPLSVRSSYSEGKRCCETICSAYCNEYEVPVKIARLAQTFGAGVSKDENRVFAQFAKCAMNSEDIVLHTKGESFGNYCYTADAVKGLLCILTRGLDAEPYNLVNEDATMRIIDMAKIVAEQLSKKEINVVYEIPEDNLLYGYAPDVTMRLSGMKARGLGWKSSIGLNEMYRRMIMAWQE